ncbi:mitochondrial carrier homolog 2 [Nematostella vectensis]|uniref:mitochondrial carrier homolog 2 n=1 Tax=Nematostella vectensis TaxID=45351 RepID=UPI0020775E6A|nr:mitochondrial carrier homolog 2 [Nematostella vectensis]
MAAFKTPGNFSKKGENDKALSLLLSCSMTAVTNPLNVVKVLIQVGHEPLPAKLTTTVFGSQVYRLPGLFQYLSHIRSAEGFFGLYRGVVPRILCQLTGSVINDFALEALQSRERCDNAEQTEKSFAQDTQDFTVETCKQTAAKCAAVVLSHPFQVITVRMVVQFVGKEAIYTGLTSSIKEIYNEHGILGFFAGLVPRIAGEVLSLWMYRSVVFIINKFFLDSEMAERKEVTVYTTALSQWLSSMFTYPFVVVSNNMISNNVGLAAGEPPAMPVYADWVDCFKHMRKTGNLWRGSSLFRRTVKTKLAIK